MRQDRRPSRVGFALVQAEADVTGSLLRKMTEWWWPECVRFSWGKYVTAALKRKRYKDDKRKIRAAVGAVNNDDVASLKPINSGVARRRCVKCDDDKNKKRRRLELVQQGARASESLDDRSNVIKRG